MSGQGSQCDINDKVSSIYRKAALAPDKNSWYDNGSIHRSITELEPNIVLA